MVITVTAALYGTRMSLLVLTWWGAVALAWAIAGPGRGPGPGPSGPRPAARSRSAGPTSGPRGMTVRWPGSQARWYAGSWCRCPRRWPG